jgi:pimeloyl-ACP methyl ester carboxylesterase
MAKRNLFTFGLAGLGVAAGVVTERLVVGRARRREDSEGGPEELEVGGATSFVTSDRAVLRVVERGEGRPLVLVHGVALSSRCWNNQLVDLCGEARVIAYDQRGHGDSDIGRQGLSLQRLATDLTELLEGLDLFDTVLVGHSLGGMVVLRMLADHPKLAAPGGRVGALALVATSATPAAGRGIPGAKALLAATQPAAGSAAWLASRLPGRTLPHSDMAFVLARMVFGAAPSAANVELTREITSRIPLGVSAELLLEIMRFDAEATLCDIDLPTRIVVGTRDLMTPVRHARALASSIPSAELVELPGCGHMPMLERRGELNEVLHQLLAVR